MHLVIAQDFKLTHCVGRYIDIVAGLAVSSQGHIVAVDSVSPTVFVISDSGELLSWFDCSDHMREPSDLAINGKSKCVIG